MQMNIFEQMKRVNEYGSECWNSRELSRAFGYSDYRNFEGAIQKAKTSCQNSGQDVKEHFGEATENLKSSNQYGETRGMAVVTTMLSRYACYLIAQNGDPRKEEIALAQTYFALQTRKQELREQMIEDGKRVFLRDEMKEHNKKLAKAAKESGVINYAKFQDYGYMGLYGGLRQRDIHVKKKLTKKEGILDHMGSEELAANLFRATQAEAKLKRESIHGEQKANKAHFEVGKKVRKIIKEIGGTMPEELPAVAHVKESEKRLRKQSGYHLTNQK